MKKRQLVSLISAAFIAIAGSTSTAQTVESLMSSGQELLQRGAYSQAVTAFKQALQREPDFFEAQFNLGFAYLQWGNHTQAVVELKKALKMQPRNSEVWSNLAIAYDNLGKSNEAMEALAQAVNSNPSNITARMNLAAMYSNDKRTQQAITQYRQIVKMDGTNAEALLNLARCLMTAGSVNEAKGYLKQAISADPNKGAAHCELGDIYWKKENDIDKAVAEYRLAISAEPTVPDAYEDLATALEAKGQKEEAIEVWGKALVYTDDSMKKEKIKEHIDLLEKGPASSASPSVEQRPEAISREQTKDLEREVRQQKPSETRRIETAPVNVGSDFQDVKEDTATIDLAKEAKKRAKEKKAGQ